ncbi:hypothetical protein [Deinococcus sp.]|uniref:HIT family protein n=1 Tax=Deinococcus sp. TaxID=47478 RepID=UPI0025ED0DDE|nr:hypothetical protein [Deinococcus sp.]
MTIWDEAVQRGIPGRLEAARRGENPTVIARLGSGWAVLGDSQLLLGYGLLLADPEVASLEALDASHQLAFLADMARLGRAVQAVTSCARVNYAVMGNTDPYLHAHIWARYDWEEPERRAWPVWNYPAQERAAPGVAFNLERHAGLLEQLCAQLQSRP